MRQSGFCVTVGTRPSEGSSHEPMFFSDRAYAILPDELDLTPFTVDALREALQARLEELPTALRRTFLNSSGWLPGLPASLLEDRGETWRN